MFGNFIVSHFRWFFIFVIIFISKSSFFGWHEFPGASMEPTIRPSENIVSNNLAYGLRLPFTRTWLAGPSLPNYGDVAVFYYPKDPTIIYVMRVIGLPGDNIFVNSAGEVRLNGERLPRSLIKKFDNGNSIYSENNREFQYNILDSSMEGPTMYSSHTVSEGHIFVLGDNRDISSDSRTWGELPLTMLRGKVIGR